MTTNALALAPKDDSLGSKASANTWAFAQTISDATASTSPTTGALKIAGGLGVAGAAFIGGVLNVAGALIYGGVTLANSVTGTGSMVLSASPIFTGTVTHPDAIVARTSTTGYLFFGTGQGSFVGNNGTSILFSGQKVSVTDTTASSAPSNGALTISGGLGVAGAIYTGGSISTNSTLYIGPGGTGSGTGALFLEGGSGSSGGGLVYLRKNGVIKWYAGAQSAILGNTSDDYLFYSNGYGSVFNIAFASGVVSVYSATVSSSTTTGALVVTGGVGIGGALYTGGNAQIGNNTADTFAVISGTGGASLRLYSGGAWIGGISNEYGLTSTGSNQKTCFYSSANLFRFYGLGTGTLVTDGVGNVSVSSDATLKIIKGSFDRGLTAIRNLSPKLYSWNEESGMETEGVYAGFIAQDILVHIPEAVGKSLNGKLTLQDRPLIAALCNAVRELADKVDTLEARLAA